MEEKDVKQYSANIEKVIDTLCFDNAVDTQNILELLPYLIKLINDKGKGYGRAYAKYGDFSIFFNLDRKYERIVNIMKQRMDGKLNFSDIPNETILDTIIDLGAYALLWAGYIKEINPQAFDEWVERNFGKECQLFK